MSVRNLLIEKIKKESMELNSFLGTQETEPCSRLEATNSNKTHSQMPVQHLIRLDNVGFENKSDNFETNRPLEDSGNQTDSIDSITDRFYSQFYNMQSDGSNKKVQFVKSNVGHPMLVVKKFAFHKHSINQKNGRINWRCSKRRVRDIRCSSSCYSMDGTVSEPSPHVQRCAPMTDAVLEHYQRKDGPSTSHKNRIVHNINTKVDSYTTLKNKELKSLMRRNAGEVGSEVGDVNRRSGSADEFDHLNESYYSHRSGSQMGDDLTSLAESFNNENMWSDNGALGVDTDYADELSDMTHEEPAAFKATENIQPENLQKVATVKQISDFACNKKEPETPLEVEQTTELVQENPYLILLSQFNELKNKKELYNQNFKQVSQELESYKKKTEAEILCLKWKSKVSDIHIASLKSLLSQKHTENKCLKKLVDEMMNKLKVDEMLQLEFISNTNKK